ncbi:MAG: hypothetical protein O2815_08155 [Actinomycetota bacterium]|nr:hypothetical protein [Actinomycetota bacterium]
MMGRKILKWFVLGYFGAFAVDVVSDAFDLISLLDFTLGVVLGFQLSAGFMFEEERRILQDVRNGTEQ